jgi:DNA-binding HxlR family transcriptional regulator
MAKRPVHDAFELLGRRWAMRVVWELRRDALGFSALRERCGVSSSVLATRLEELADAKVVHIDASGRYVLTVSGRELARLLFEINRWAEASGSLRLSSQG